MKISVQLEADSPEEFRSLITSFFIPTTADAGVPPPEPEVLTPIQQSVRDGTFGVQSAPESEVTVPATVEPKRPRGRPRKEPVAAAPVPEPTTTPAPPPAPVEPPQPAAAATGNGEVLTRQDLLDAFAEYVQRYGASFGYTDISKLLQSTLGDTVRKASDVPEQALPQAIGAIKAALNDNPFNRKRDYA